MSAIWSDEARLARWFEVELAALEGWAEIGGVPRAAVEAIRATASVPSPERVAELEARTQHDVAAFVDAVAEQLGDEGRWFHYGLTSSDVLDTALALQLRDAGALILDGLERDRRGHRPGRGAPADAHDRAHPRSPRRADHVRPQAGRVGVRARTRPGA